MNEDEEFEYHELKSFDSNKKRAVIIALISVFIVLAITAGVLFYFIKKNRKKNNDNSSISQETKSQETKNDIESSEQSVSVVNSDITDTKQDVSESAAAAADDTTLSETESATETESETESPTTTEAEIEHGFVINNMGYTYLYKDQGFEQFNGSATTAKRYAAALNVFKERLPETMKFYSIVVPTSVAFSNIPREIRQEDDFSNSNQNININTINELLEGFTSLNIYPDLDAHSEEYLYFRTDRNWTSLAAYYAYVEFCESAGLTPVPIEEYEKTVLEGYLGSFYNATGSKYLYDNPDTVECYLIDNKYPVEMTLYNDGLVYGNRQLVTTQISSPVSYAYFAFLGGPGQRFEIKTANTDGKKILVVGDGSAFPFVPYLAAHYSNIYFIDPEAYSSRPEGFMLDDYAAEKGIDEVLFITYATNTQRSSYCEKITSLYN